MQELVTRNFDDYADANEKCLDVNGERDGDGKTSTQYSGSTDEDGKPDGTFNKCAKRFDRICLIVSVLCVLLFVFFVIIIALAVRVGNLERRGELALCNTAECLDASSKIVKNWNTTIDPCQDFWSFSCGKWIHKHPLPRNKGSLNVLDLVEDGVQKRLRNLLDLVPHDASVRDPSWKTYRFFQSCMNVIAVEQTEATFRNILNEIGGWTLLSSWSSQRWDRGEVIKELQVLYGVTPFFKLVVEPNDYAPTANIIKILPSGLGLASPSHYFLPDKNKYETIYRTYMDDVARQFGATVTEANRFAVNTFNFEKRLAEVTPGPEAYRDPFSHYKKMTVQDLSFLAPTIPWLSLLQNYFSKAKISPTTDVVIFSESYFKNLSYIMSSTDNIAMHNYLMWQFTFTYAPHLSNNFRVIANRFYQSLEGVPNPRGLNSTERWEYCLKVTSTYLGHALGAMYVKHYVVPDLTNQVDDVTNRIKTAFLNHLGDVPWVENSNSRMTVKEKVEMLSVDNGYPDFVLNPDAIEEYYKELFVQGDFLENIKSGKHFLRKKLENRLISQVKLDEGWSVFPQDMQPVYHYPGNQLVIPAGLLQSPIFMRDAPISVLFGALGTHIASQMFKVLDDKGILYQKHGILDPWLSGNSATRYHRTLECLKERLSPEVDNGTTIATLTVGELVADVAAVKFAYRAYRKMERELELPAIGRNHDQVFFIAYAQSMCENIRLEKVQNWLGVNTMSPHQTRVLNALNQVSEFASAFSCASGSGMLQARQCHIW